MSSEAGDGEGQVMLGDSRPCYAVRRFGCSDISLSSSQIVLEVGVIVLRGPGRADSIDGVSRSWQPLCFLHILVGKRNRRRLLHAWECTPRFLMAWGVRNLRCQRFLRTSEHGAHILEAWDVQSSMMSATAAQS